MNAVVQAPHVAAPTPPPQELAVPADPALRACGEDDQGARAQIDAQIGALRQAVQARDRFLAVAAHELRSALTPVASLADYLDVAVHQSGASLEQVVPLIDSLGQAMHRYMNRTTLLLEAARLMAGAAYRPMPSSVDLSGLVRDAVMRVQAGAMLVGSPLLLQIADDVVVSVDRAAVEIVVDNLLSNAVRYGAGGPIAVVLARISAEDGSAGARLSISDEGPGIAEDEQARLFEPFERTACTTAAGFGIGLWVARQMIVAAGGALDVDSTPGRGSCFAVTLPL